MAANQSCYHSAARVKDMLTGCRAGLVGPAINLPVRNNYVTPTAAEQAEYQSFWDDVGS